MERQTYYYESAHFPQAQFASQLREMVAMYYESTQNQSPVAFLCIGTTKISGDSLGPYIGEILKKQGYPYVYGTVRRQVHACNLGRFLRKIEKEAPGVIIAIDASIGAPRHVGCITLSNQPLFPGKSLSKNLPPAGHLSITGIVSGESKHPLDGLNRIPREKVHALAHCIANGIQDALIPQLRQTPNNQNQWVPQRNPL